MDHRMRRKALITLPLTAIGREAEIKLLNEKLVDDELKKSVDLPRAFLKNKENKNLFVNPVKFRRIK